jgi:hypothetical protein
MCDAIAAWRAADEVFADPRRFVGITRAAADDQAKSDASVARSGQAQTQSSTWPGVEVRLPDGSRIPDRHSPTGYVMSRVPDLTAVAEAGHRAGAAYFAVAKEPTTAADAAVYLATTLGINLGHGGTFDYQRSGSLIAGYTQFPQFRDVSNINVGLFAQQAGLTLEDALEIAGGYALLFSSNRNLSDPHGLDSQTKEFITTGFAIGESGVFGPSAGP